MPYLWKLLTCLTVIVSTDGFSNTVSNQRAKQQEAIERFTSELQNILDSSNAKDEFISLTLNGIKAPRKTKKMSDEKKALVDLKKEQLRGKIREVQGRMIALKPKQGKKKASELLLQATVKYHSATDLVQNYELKSFTLDQFFNNSVESEWGASKETLPIQSAEIKTVQGTWKLDLKGKSSLKYVKNKKTVENTQILSHDQKKNVLLSPSALFFQKLGITDGEGKPKVARKSKLRQTQKFVEIVSRLVDESGITDSSKSIHTVDMGCGRGYLTFALHSLLFDKYKGINVQSRGIDVRPKLMKEVDDIARDLGSDFDGLHFTTGTIESAELDHDLDVLIALHACDTATDDSLFYGIKKSANIIVTAPCCHKQVRMYLDAHVAKDTDHPYADVLRHNIYKERIAETVTDSIRALLLELADYDVQVFEFIGGEHTSKNVMITGVKRRKSRTESEKEALRSRLKSLCELHGIKKQKFADLMNEPIIFDNDKVHTNMPGKRKAIGMPPL